MRKKIINSLNLILVILALTTFIWMSNVKVKANVINTDGLTLQGQIINYYHGAYYFNRSDYSTYEDTLLIGGSSYHTGDEINYQYSVQTNDENLVCEMEGINISFSPKKVGTYKVTITVSDNIQGIDFVVEIPLFVLSDYDQVVVLGVGGEKLNEEKIFAEYERDIYYPFNERGYLIDGYSYVDANNYSVDEYKNLTFEILVLNNDYQNAEEYSIYLNIDNDRFIEVDNADPKRFTLKLNNYSIVCSIVNVSVMINGTMIGNTKFEIAESYQFNSYSYSVNYNGSNQSKYSFSIGDGSFNNSDYYYYEWFVATEEYLDTNRYNFTYEAFRSPTLTKNNLKGTNVTIDFSTIQEFIPELPQNNTYYVYAICYNAFEEITGINYVRIVLSSSIDQLQKVNTIVTNINNLPEIDRNNYSTVKTSIQSINTLINELDETYKPYISNYSDLLKKSDLISSYEKAISFENYFNDIIIDFEYINELEELDRQNIKQMIEELSLSEKALLNDQSLIPNLNLYIGKKEKVDACELAIDRLIEDPSNDDNYRNAMHLYELLLSDEIEYVDSNKVTELLTISNDRKANELANKTIDAINSIGVVEFTDTCYKLIVIANDLYNSIEQTYRNKVTNYQTLSNAIDKYQSLKRIDNCIKQISTLLNSFEVNEDDLILIEALYDNLFSDEKNQISNHEALVNLRKAFDIKKNIDTIPELTKQNYKSYIDLINTINTNINNLDNNFHVYIDNLQEFNSNSELLNNYQFVSEYELLLGTSDLSYSSLNQLSESDKGAISEYIISFDIDYELVLLLDNQDSYTKVKEFLELNDKIINTELAIDEAVASPQDKDLYNKAIYLYDQLGDNIEYVDQTKDQSLQTLSNKYANIDVVSDIIESINNLGEIVNTSESIEKVNICNYLFNKLSSEQKLLVTNQNILTSALERVSSFNKINECINLIKELLSNELTNDSFTTIDNKYNLLTDDEKSLVTNYSNYTKIKEAYQTNQTISNLPAITIDNHEEYENEINELVQMIDSFTDYQLLVLTNKSRLTTLVNEINSYKRIKIFLEAINGISLTLNDFQLLDSQKIELIKNSLNNLTLDDLDLFNNESYEEVKDILFKYERIIETEKIIEELLNNPNDDLLKDAIYLYNQLSQDEILCLDKSKEAALKNSIAEYDFSDDISEAMRAIENIGVIDNSKESYEKIAVARYLYSVLSQEAKMQVMNYSLLEDAEAKYQSLYEIDKCIIAIIDLSTKYSFTEEELVKVENMYFELDENERLAVNNYSLLKELRISFSRNSSSYEKINEIELSVNDKINLFINTSNPEEGLLIIKEKGGLSDLGFYCDYLVDGYEVVSGYTENNSLYLYPYGVGKARIVCYCKLNDSKTLTKVIEVNVYDAEPTTVISLEKESEGPVTIYDTVNIHASLSYEFNLSPDVTYKWYINNTLIENNSDNYSHSFNVGKNTVKVIIDDPINNIHNLVGERTFNVLEVKDTEYTISLNYTEKVYILKGAENLVIQAFLNDDINSDFTYNWTILDTSIIKFYVDPNGSHEVAIEAIKQGETKVLVMVDTGKYESKILMQEIIISVINNIETLELVTSSDSYAPNTDIYFSTLINGISGVANTKNIWQVTDENDNEVAYTIEDGKMKLTGLEKGKYNVKLKIEDFSAEKTIKVKSLVLEKILFSILPVAMIAALIILAAYVLLRKRKRPLLYAKDETNNVIDKIKEFVSEKSDNMDEKKLHRKTIFFLNKIYYKIVLIKVKLEDFTIEENVDFTELINQYMIIEKVIASLIKAYRNNIMDNNRVNNLLVKLIE